MINQSRDPTGVSTRAVSLVEEEIVPDPPEAGSLSQQNDASSVQGLGFQQVLDENIEALLELMTELKGEIKDEWRKVKAGEVGEKDFVRKIKTELPALITLTMQQESKLHDHTAERSGKAGEYALDLGQARASIGERLTRLRSATASG